MKKWLLLLFCSAGLYAGETTMYATVELCGIISIEKLDKETIEDFKKFGFETQNVNIVGVVKKVTFNRTSSTNTSLEWSLKSKKSDLTIPLQIIGQSKDVNVQQLYKFPEYIPLI